MKKLPWYLLTFAALLILGATGYFTVLYVSDGTIVSVLKNYEISKNADAVRNHLLEYHGEAQGHEARIQFVAWGIDHQEEFIEIAEGIDPLRRSEFCKLLAFAATDSGQESNVEASFQGYDSECVHIIRTEISNTRSLQRN